ncbi:hypothetical protein [Herbiconiux daphne]|uniref:C-type lysozyme inhibitor domain-containing protein n=1 Tax=Herbiconiux daphne TaxID=2970914 RepID=A0ABT2HAT8_9MICO|nr:hypothetical protein [Herbiconiux daphne]MCS5736976.1 hypothetical protein [Herbiconiux daphne]
MKLAVLVSVCLLAGCTASQPVKTVSKPVGTKHAVCKTEHSINAQVVATMNPVSVTDYGRMFSVTNSKGKTVAVSPVLTANANGNIVGFKDKLMYVKGTGAYEGFYGVFDSKDSKRLDALTFDCR